LEPSTSITLQDCLEAMFEIFRSSPTIARDLGEMARQRGVSFELLMHEAIAVGCYKNHRPLPPELHEYLTRHATRIDPDLRAKLLKPLPS
jgi:hypothetical protein